MDRDNQPSTSKKAMKARSTSASKTSHTMYPVSFEQFKKFVNVEDFVLKEMERAGSEACRINYKIRHKYYPAVYKQFYSNKKTRDKMLRNGLTLKPIPKFLKEKLMRMPDEDDESSTRLHKEQEKPPECRTKARYNQETTCAIAANKEPNHWKENSSHDKRSSKITPKKLKPLVAESLKITSFFTALASAQKSPKSKLESRKRKSESSTENAETKPQIKRLKDSASSRFEPIPRNSNNIPKANKNLTEHLIKAKTKRKIPKDLVSDDSDVQSDLQIMVDVAVPLNAALNKSKENVHSPKKLQSGSRNKKGQIKIELHRSKLKAVENKRKSDEKQTKGRCKSLDDEISDDSDIASNTEIIDLSASPRKNMENPNLSVKSPLPRRNRIEDFKKPTLSLRTNKKRKGREQNERSSCDTEMALLSLSGVDNVKVGRTTNEIHEWREKGLKALEDKSDDELNPTEYFTQEFIGVDRLKAINTYPEEVRKYIKYLLKLEVSKRKDINTEAEIPQESSKSKVVSAFLQMTFDDYKCLINVEKLLSQGKTTPESVETITENLKKQYEAIITRKKPWPEGVHIKLSTLKKFLISKGLRQPIQLKDIPPRILCFEEVLEYTNLKECTSLSRMKPPDTYKYLLHLCKQEYTKCCLDGIWIEGIRFTDTNDLIEEPVTILENTVSGSISMPPLRVFSSDLRSTLENLDKVIVDSNANNKGYCTQDSGTQEVVNNALNESSRAMFTANVNSPLNSGLVEFKENTDKNKESQKQENSIKRHISEEEEIENCLDEIFKSATNTQELKFTTDDVITDVNELVRTLSKDSDNQIEASTSEETNVLQCSIKESEGVIIDDSPDSAGQLINIILQSPLTTPLETCAKSLLNPSPNNKLSKPPEVTGRIPPSPNLFQSSGESDPICSEPQQIQVETPEAVYVPCKHSVTNNTEENNLTALSLNQTSVNPDPFDDASTNVGGMNMTTLLTPDPNIVVKQEHISMRDAGVDNSYVGLDDSVQIIELPPPEPIVIEDEETAPDLLEMLLSRPTKPSNEKTTAVNLTQLPSSSSLENFPLAQRLSSNLDLTQGQSTASRLHDESSVSQTEKNINEEITKATDSDNRFDRTKFIRNNKEANEKQTCAKSMASNLTAQSDAEGSPKLFEESTQLSKETPLSGSSVETSYVFIVPQNIPSDIELTQNSLNKSPSEPINLKEGNCGFQQVEVSRSFFEDASKSGKIDQETSKDIPESAESVYYVYVTKEGDVSKVVSSSNDIQTTGNSGSIEESSIKIENTEISKDDMNGLESSASARKSTKKSTCVRSSENVSSEYVEKQRTNQSILDADISKDNIQGVQLLEYNNRENTSKSSMNAQNAGDLDAVLSRKIVQNAQLTGSTQRTATGDLKLSMEDGEQVGKKQIDESLTIISQTNAHCTLKVNDRLKNNCYNSREVELYEESALCSITNAGSIDVNAPESLSLEQSQNSVENSSRGELWRSSPNVNISKSIANVDSSTYDYSECTRQIQGDSGDVSNNNVGRTESVNVCQTVEQIDKFNTNKPDQQIRVLMARNPQMDLGKNKERIDREPTNNNQQSESGHFLTEFGHIPILGQTSDASESVAHIQQPNLGEEILNERTKEGPEVNLNIPRQSIIIASEEIDETTNTSSNLVYNCQPFVFHKRNVYNIPALLPIAALQNGGNNDNIGTLSTDGEIENDDLLIEVPFLINRKLIESLPFDLVTAEQMKETNRETTIYALKVNLELKLNEHCLSINTCPERGEGPNEEPVIADLETPLSPTINRCQFDENVIRDWLGAESIVTTMVPAATSIDVEPTRTGIIDDRALQSIDNKAPPKVDGKAHTKNVEANNDSPANIVGDHSHSNSSIPPQTDKPNPVQSSGVSSKTKPCPKSKKKQTIRRKHSESDFVPQRTHAFRSLPLGASKKPILSETVFKEPSLTTIEEIDYVIEDASQVIVSSTASQILGTDNTYFEGSQLLRNIENYSVPEQQIESTKEHTPSAEPQVNSFSRITTMCEGIMARKVWQVNLQLKPRDRIEIEVRFVADKRSLTVCGKSAELLFNFSPAIWSDVFRVVREIDHFEYKRRATKNSRPVTPLHDVLRSLFDSAPQVVNIKMLNDSFNPYVTCEKVPSVYRKPFQCLTKAIPTCILNRMKALKENLRNNNSDE